MRHQHTTRARDFPGKRWLNVGLRAVHVVGLILLGASILTGSGNLSLAIALTVPSGLVMFLIDTWANPGHLREIAGFGVIVKLGLVWLMYLQPGFALELFWSSVILATVLSHAPANFRHWRLF